MSLPTPYTLRVRDLTTGPDDEFGNPRLWSEDRLHLSSEGHLRVAAAAAEALGLRPDVEGGPPLPRDWRAPLDPADAVRLEPVVQLAVEVIDLGAPAGAAHPLGGR